MSGSQKISQLPVLSAIDTSVKLLGIDTSNSIITDVQVPISIILNGSLTFVGTAEADITNYTAIAMSSGGLAPGDNNTTAYFNSIVGIALTTTTIGNPVTIQNSGVITYSGWNWSLGQPIFIGSAGVLTQTVPISGFVQTIGVAITAQSFVINISIPILI